MFDSQNLVHKYNLNSNQFLVSQSLINDYSVNQRVTIESLLLQQFHDHMIVYTHHAITLEVQKDGKSIPFFIR